MGSITDALKAKGATGSNIAECIENLPSSSGGSVDPGYTVEEVTKKLYFDGEIVTENPDPNGSSPAGNATLTLEEGLFDQIVVITYDGTPYICTRGHAGMYPSFGAPYNGGRIYFTDYPFIMTATNGYGTSWAFMSEIAGTHTLRIEIKEEVATTTSDFKKAVNSVTALVVTYTGNSADKTYQECLDAWNQGRIIVFRDPDPYGYYTDTLARHCDGDGSPNYFKATVIYPNNYSSSDGTVELTEQRLTLDANDQFRIQTDRYVFANVVMPS